MTDRGRVTEPRLRIVTGPIPLWVAFLAVHAILGVINLTDMTHLPFGDVQLVYRYWVEYAEQNGVLVGIDTAWVYPIGALLPMLLAGVFGLNLYGVTWLAMVLLLNCATLLFLDRRSRTAAWWWTGFLALLGPIALGRIDSISVPFAIFGVVLVVARPMLAGALLAAGAWIKVWPAALVLAAVIAVRDRARIITGAALTTAAVILVAILAGGGGTVLSFITEQTNRGVQVESPAGAIWLWLGIAGVPGSGPYWNPDILTYQVDGPGVELAATLLTPVLALATVAVGACGVLAVRRGVGAAQLLAPLSLALVLSFVAFNKVGSPQFIAWLAAPVVLGLIQSGRAFRLPALVVMAIALITQVVYPWGYDALLALDPALIAILTLRHLLVFLLLAWAVRMIALMPPADETLDAPAELVRLWQSEREEAED